MPGILQFWQDNDIMSEKGTGYNGLNIIRVGPLKGLIQYIIFYGSDYVK